MNTHTVIVIAMTKSHRLYSPTIKFNNRPSNINIYY